MLSSIGSFELCFYLYLVSFTLYLLFSAWSPIVLFQIHGQT